MRENEQRSSSPRGQPLRMLLRKTGDWIRKPVLRIRPDDIFLVSYPRSGNTWLRFLLANLIGFEVGKTIDFFSVREIVPDVHMRDQRQILASLPSPRLIKSHSQYSPDYPRVLYLVRDGRDVYASYYDYLSRQGHFHGTFTEFLQSQDVPYGHWHEHVNGWLAASRTTDLLLVRYEDLFKTAHQELERIARFIGVDTSPTRLDYAIERSSLARMRKMEEAEGRPYGDPSFHFVRRGKSRGWLDVFGEIDKEIMKSRANGMLAQLGYIDTPEW